MRFFRRVSLVLGILFLSVLLGQAAAAENQPSALETYASELSAYTSLKYYKNEKTQRYVDYKAIHADLGWEKVITYVNIGLDYYFYSNTSVVANPAATSALVNKYHPLPSDYVPPHLEYINPAYSYGDSMLTHEARVAFERMCSDAEQLGYTIFANSGYRSYAAQKEVYESYYDPSDPNSAYYQALLAAKPGFSEHQTGLAVDIIRASDELRDTAVYRWYSKNCYKYGFIIRYPYAMEPIVGYSSEPWHLRYLGIPLATAVTQSGLTYDEYYAREIDITAKSAAATAVGVTAVHRITAEGNTYALSTYDVLGTSYYRLRDVAAVLNKSPLQFDIVWDAATSRIRLLPGIIYTGDPALSALDPAHTAAVTAVKPALQVGETVSTPDGYAVYGANYLKLGDLLALVGAHAEDKGTGSLVIVPGTAAAASPSPSAGPLK